MMIQPLLTYFEHYLPLDMDEIRLLEGRIFRIIMEDKFIELQNHVLLNISSTAEERYLAFLEKYPKLALRLPNTQIASYLGITPEFLSKF